MAQILRVFKTPEFTLIRAFTSKRSKKNHYDTLRISRSSSQKEIRAAFVKLSKKVHPDVNKKAGSHNDFVALNEAYNILSKENSRKNYDHELQYREVMERSGQSVKNVHSNPNMHWAPYDKTTGSQKKQHKQANGDEDDYPTGKEWYYRTAHTEEPTEEYRKKSTRTAISCIIVMVAGTIVQVLLVRYSTTFQRDKMMERSRKLEAEYAQLKEEAESRTLAENISLCREKWEKQQARIEELERAGKFKI